jgi:hypothetical protein
MARRTVDLLPEIFRTQTNKQFLGATLDQLTQEPNIKRTQGYVGRRVGPGVNPADNYVVEPTARRSDYQLEPGVVFFKPDTDRVEDLITYPGMIDALDLQGANTQRQDRLFSSQYYSWDPFCDLDKFTNYSQYYWLPEGPNSVDVSTAFVPSSDGWEITRRDTQGVDGYQFSDVAGLNPIITLVRGGNYTFAVNQAGHGFWIQAARGVNGTMPATPNISSRDVLGVINNGEDLGTVTFNVPSRTAQDFYINLNDIGGVDLLTNLKFNQLNNVFVNQFLIDNPNGIDGITNLEGRTVVFTNTTIDPEAGGWQVTTQFDPLSALPDNNGLTGSFDTTLFDETVDIVDPSIRYSIWQITYQGDPANPYMRLNPVQSVTELDRFRIQFGAQWASTSWYKNASGVFEQVPLITATLDTLWYQDGTNPEIFGQIRLVDQSEDNPIDINEIIGAKDYTAPNGVVFTNGLKVQFRGPTVPAGYQNLEYYVEGVGTGPGIDARVGFVDGEAYFGPWHEYQGRKLTGASHSNGTFQQYIYDSVEESIINAGAGEPLGAPLPVNGILNATAGNGIKLLPVKDFVTPETYTKSTTEPYDSTAYDSTPYDAELNAPQVPDYLTINRASRDRNAWTRSNRWFHEQVIRATAEYNNQEPVLNNEFRGKRPIIEFRANIRLFEFGTQGKNPVDIIDFSATDAFSNINGQTGYFVDGYEFINGSRVIFAADLDPDVRNKVYVVNFIDPDGDKNSPKIINLVPAPDATVYVDQTVVCLTGVTLQGKSFWFDGVNWQLAQQKTNVNQAPLYNVFDTNGRSFGDRAVYPSSTFAGSKLFGYGVGPGTVSDPVLGFPLKYLNFNNVGDIVFENYLYNDTFLYVKDAVSNEEPISQGFARQYIDRTEFSDLIGWQPAAAENRSRQVFRYIYDGSPLILDVPVDVRSPYPPLQIFQGTEFIDPTQYTYSVGANSTTVTLTTAPEIGTILEVQAISDVPSSVAYYQVPLNLENNPLNENSERFTLGSIRTHYESIGQNLKNIQGPVVGSNNTRDLGNILIYGDNIVQHSSPLSLAGPFLRQRQFEVVEAIEFNSREYQKYKALLLDLAAKGNFINDTPTQVLDSVMEEISLGRTTVSPFYWSDMVPSGENYTETVYTYTPISIPIFDTINTYDFSSSNYQGLLIYLNGTLLLKGYDYEVGVDSRTVTVTVPLSVGDKIAIREFSATYGSYVPNTPTKMGLYPAFKPEIYIDESYVTPTKVIRGHDGSITVAFNDYRDDVLLEFEKRIFDNLKVASEIPLQSWEVIPGQFRTTDYSLGEINDLLVTDFLSWVGWNKLDYTSQIYLANEPFTYNYSQSANKLTGAPSLGAWRGIYNYFYDTITPNTTPWQMLGFSEQPDWWESYYGPAPYTSGNLVLWQDLENGLVRDPAGEYILPQYRRPGLTSVIPSGSEGELLPPLQSTIGNYDGTSFRRSWTFGDDGPVESAWRTSSAWPFAVMRLLALTKPAKFLSLFADRDRYKFDASLDQYLWDGRYRLDATRLAPLYGDGVSKASYINWIIDYNRQLGVNSTRSLTIQLSNIGVRLCWRLAGFSDKKYLKIFAERSTPNSLNTGLLLPDESYQLLLYKNQPFQQVAYSSVVVQSTDTGYQVFGYNTVNPYFEILASRPNGNLTTITVADQTVRVALDHSQDIVRVPYGYTFTNETAVCDFLYSYGKMLSDKGFVFETRENGYILNWLQMAQEFLYWSQQGWAPGSIINLNPGATRVSVTRPGAVVDSLGELRPENLILNQNRQPLPASDLVIERLDNTFAVNSLTSNTINFLNVSFTAYEHVVVLDNVSIFADLIYQPVTGLRQSRVQVSGVISADWNGTLNAPGFVLNQDNIRQWVPNQTYAKGEIVLFKNEYWSASTIIQPSQDFDYSLWIKSDYDQIQKGLLPNAANASDQLATAYSVNSASLEAENDLFSYGLIGFRPREYMQALNLDDVSQVNLYQQFLGSKGTIRAAEIFTFANLGKEIAQYDIYEYWAMLKSQYGATANRNYFELRLNEALLRSDPSLIQVIEPQQTSQADQTVLLQNIWKTSTPLSSTNILPTTLFATNENSLPSAGYANLNDVDFTIFDIRDFATSSSALDQDINDLGVGSTIWAAKSNAYDWNVYRVESVPGDIISVSDNLNGQALVTFNQQHGLVAGDYIIIRFFDTNIDGTYQVLSVPGLDTVTILYAFSGSQTSVLGEGVAFTLESARVTQAADVAKLSYSKEIEPGSRAWVDNDGQNRWTVLEKTQPFSGSSEILVREPRANGYLGTKVVQGFNNLSAMVSAPGVGSTGSVYTFVKDDTNEYVENITLTLDTLETAGFGRSMSIGDQTWSVIGAPDSRNKQGYALIIDNPPTSNAFAKWQLLVRPAGNSGDEFGHSVAVSQDERWIYVGAPGENRVYAYGRVDVQNQFVKYIANGSVSVYNFGNNIVVNDGIYLNVTLSGILLTYNVDYTVDLSNGTITLASTPTLGQELIISRRMTSLQVALGGTVFDISDVYGCDNLDSFAVFVNDVIQRPGIDYILSGTDIVFAAPPAVNAAIRVRAGTYYKHVETLEILPVIKTYTSVSSSELILTVDNTLDIVPHMTITGSGFSADQYVTEILSDTQVKISSAPSGIPSGALTFTLPANSRFGHSLRSTTDGRQIMIGVPGSGNNTGQVIVFDRAAQRFQVGLTPATSYTTAQSLSVPGSPITVILNGEYLISNADNIGVQYSITGNTVTLDTAPSIGDILEIETNHFRVSSAITNISPEVGAQYGFEIEQCTNDCSLYIGAPYDSSVAAEAGQVEFRINQSRVFGTTISSAVNPTLVPGQTLRVDDYFISVPTPADWIMSGSSNVEWPVNSIATDNSILYRAKLPVPAGISITDPNYWQTINWPTALSVAINSGVNGQNVPNVVASLTSDIEYTADGKTRTFSTGDLYLANDITLVYVDNTVVPYTYDNVNQTVTFAVAPADQQLIRIIGSRLILSVKNSRAANPASKLTVLPGTGAVYEQLRFDNFVYAQTIESPIIQAYAHFGMSISIAETAVNLVVGAPDATAIEATTFDQGTTKFDASSLRFFDPVSQSGVVYTYDLLPAAIPSASNPPQFVFGQQIYDTGLDSYDLFGTSVDYTTGILLIGVPGYARPAAAGTFQTGQTYVISSVGTTDFTAVGASSNTVGVTFVATGPGTGTGVARIPDTGRIAEFRNPDRIPAWKPVRVQQPVVDIALINTTFMYDVISGEPKQYFDFFDPLQGKLLGAVRQNLDYIGALDPAAYNAGEVNNYGQRWAQDRVGQIWWDTENVRFVDTNQDDIVYASRRWGQVFPGSSVDVYQWISSTVPPSRYAGPGTPRSQTSYSVVSTINEQGLFTSEYFFWVSGIRTVNRTARKTLSIDTLARYIESPKSSGISYIAPINASTVAIYNGLSYISAQDTILHIEYDQTRNEDAVHAEYHLIAQDREDGFLTPGLYQKFQDSFCGVDSVGNLVPDPLLPLSEQYGVEFRPRQSMFANRFLALKNYLTRSNDIMLKFPISESRVFPLLESQEPEPSASSGAWNFRVANITELSYQDLATVPLGYKYLVSSDSSNNGLWAIYEVQSGVIFGSKNLGLIRVQNYDTNKYWEYVDWWAEGYGPLDLITVEVPNYSALDTITVPDGSLVKVTANAQGKYEIYLRENNSWIRVGLEDGTIQIKSSVWDYSVDRFGFDVEVFDAQYFDQEPVIETRKIIQSLNQEIFIDDLAIERNRLLILMFNYILTEQIAPLWLTKTSLIDVDHTIRQLEPYQIYRQDNQDFVLNYIQEVKPYHTQIRQFNLIYEGDDTYDGTVTDFDLPAYWDASENLFVSPVLDDSFPPILSTTSSVPSTSEVWQTLPWNQWYQNYLLSIQSVTVYRGGEGYVVAPEVVVTGVWQTAPELRARINSAGAVVAVDIVKPGSGFLTTPVISLIGGLTEARPWLPSTEFFAGTTIETPAGLVYVVVDSGVSSEAPPVETQSTVNGTLALNYLGTRAVAVPVMGGQGIGLNYGPLAPDPTDEYYNLVRSLSTTIKFDRYQYRSDIVDWQPNIEYPTGTWVRYDDRVWSANSTVDTPTFEFPDWTLVPADTLSGVDRTMGYYVPQPDMPGLDLALLISGVDYPGVQVSAPSFSQNTGFDVGNYDINPYDNISFGPEGRPTYDPAILDAIYESEFTDPYLGVLPAPAYDGDPPTTGPANAITVDGGEFVDTYESHAPEELVPGIIYDTLDMRVFTTPGSDWEIDGHGFAIKSKNYVCESVPGIYSYAGLVDYPATITVIDETVGVALTKDLDYIVDWVNETVTIIGSSSLIGNVLSITAYGVGGGNQIYRNTYDGSRIDDAVVLPVQFSLIESMVVFVNGVPVSNYEYYAFSARETEVAFDTAWGNSDRVTIWVFSDSTQDYSWSTPVTQTLVYDGNGLSFTLTNSMTYTNPANIIVEKNGIRARPAEGIEYVGDGSTVTYELPTRGGYSQALIADNEVTVYVDSEPLILGVGFQVDAYDLSSNRTVTLTQAPAEGSVVMISVNHAADYYISSGNTLIWRATSPLLPLIGDILTFTTFNDTRQQGFLTQVFVGPEIQDIQVGQAYDTTRFDQGDITGDPGSFDYANTLVGEVNRFDTGRPIINSSRLTVTLNGRYLFDGSGFLVDGTAIVIPGAPIGVTDVVAITSVTQSVIPGEIAFRIFQDMRGAQFSYRITASSTTLLAETLLATDDVIYLVDASRVSEPNLEQGLFGQITINGERITYRTRNTANNTLSGLRRGTAGTGAADHIAGAAVYDIGIGNLLPIEYQNYVLKESIIANGTQVSFTAPDLIVGYGSLEPYGSTPFSSGDVDFEPGSYAYGETAPEQYIEVYVGGSKVTQGYTIPSYDPVVVVFDIAPPAGVEVTIQVYRGKSWYLPNSDMPLQEQPTLAARFIRGV